MFFSSCLYFLVNEIATKLEQQCLHICTVSRMMGHKWYQFAFSCLLPILTHIWNNQDKILRSRLRVGKIITSGAQTFSFLRVFLTRSMTVNHMYKVWSTYKLLILVILFGNRGRPESVSICVSLFADFSSSSSGRRRSSGSSSSSTGPSLVTRLVDTFLAIFGRWPPHSPPGRSAASGMKMICTLLVLHNFYWTKHSCLCKV